MVGGRARRHWVPLYRLCPSEHRRVGYIYNIFLLPWNIMNVEIAPHDITCIARVISRCAIIAPGVQYHTLRDSHAYFHDITQEHFPRGQGGW